MRHLVIPVAFTDIDALTGAALIYELQPGEWLLASWRVVTTVFNDGSIILNLTSVLVAEGSTSPMDDALDVVSSTSAGTAIDGLIGPDPSSGPGSLITNMLPFISPATVAVQLDLDFTGGNPLTGDGTAGQLDQHLLILSAP